MAKEFVARYSKAPGNIYHWLMQKKIPLSRLLNGIFFVYLLHYSLSPSNFFSITIVNKFGFVSRCPMIFVR